MNLKKHLFGLAIFSVIVLSAVLVKALLVVTPGEVMWSPPAPPTRMGRTPVSYPLSYKVKLVSLDFINRQSYVALELRREDGAELPARIFVTTQFFLPDNPSRVWTSRAQITRPFEFGDRFDYVATAACDWCDDTGAPRAGYFARVYVSTDYVDHFSEEPYSNELSTATPVVVQAESSPRPIRDPVRKF